MPEIKNVFSAGKMNKDLDERLIPNGQYRDALNIKISSSEGADVGAIENILGNTAIFNRSYNEVTNSYTQWGLNDSDTNYYGFDNCKTVGVIRYDRNEKIYWLLSGSNQDGILEFDQTTKVVSPVVIDKNNVLKFSSNTLITGINIIDGLLFFTDDLNEPKCINIERFKTAAAASGDTSHTEIYGRDFIESDVTVIKKSPITAPTLEMYRTKQLDNNGNVTNVDTGWYGALGSNVDGEPTPFDPGTAVTMYWNQPYPFYNVGDTLVLTASNGEDDEDHIARVKVFEVPTGNTQNFAKVNVLSINTAPATSTFWEVTLEQTPPMFEFKFARFAYRYIYNDNQVSCFSPFSEPAFLPDEKAFEYNPEQGYNVLMKNTVRNLKVKNFASSGTVPSDVEKIDILYKDSSNQNVYVVDTIEKDSSGNFANQYSIKSEIISKVIESNQILRPFDNVPRKAKSQEIIANRLVYANYLQNFDIKNANGDIVKPKVSINIDNYPTWNITNESAGKSIKTLRTYQIGVAYRDEHGRETPVFSSETSSTVLGKTSANLNNRISAVIESDPPEGFTHFKFFVKENSNEYYNLSMDRFYVESDDNVWISFPSSERNKIKEDDFIILKKQHDSNNFVDEEARYKIIALENEAPDTIKTKNVNKAKIQGSGNNNTFVSDGQPVETALTLKILNQAWVDSGADSRDNALLGEPQLCCKIFTETNTTPVFYDIESIQKVGSGNDAHYKITLNKPLSGMAFATSNGQEAVGLGINIFQKEIQNKPEFAGRFFAKIYSDKALVDRITSVNEKEGYAIASTRTLGKMTRFGDNDDNWKSGDRGWHIDNSQPRYHTAVQGGLLPHNSTLPGETLNVGAKRGRGTRVGSKYIDICYFKWGPGSGSAARNAWDGYWWGFENKVPDAADTANFLQSPGQKIRWTDDPDGTIYEIVDYARVHCVTYKGSKKGKFASSRLIRFTIELDKPLTWSPDDSLQLTEVGGSTTTNLEFLRIVDEESGTYTSKNPAIFETEPDETVDIDIYYEASDNIPIAQHGTEALPSTHDLDWFNCYSFNNGVESDRIRDDFNAVRIGKGVKVSATLDEPYQEERRGSGLIFSQIFNSLTGTNKLNQFIQAQPITKDLNPANGSIQKLHARDTDLVVMCEDKVLKILAQKDALFNADGSANVTSNAAVLGQAIPFVGEYGISKNPESYAYYGFRSYFTDKNRGVVLRLSRDGLEEISSNGMSDYFSDKLASENTMIGNYDEDSGCYNVSFSDETVSFEETVRGWPTRKSFVAEAGVSLNNIYYTFKDGVIWSHDNQTRNNFYGTQYKSTVKLVFNESPSKIKNFKTIFYEGDSGWTCPKISTDQQDGSVPSFSNKEGIYYNFIKGIENTWDNNFQAGTLDTKEFSTQGIDILGSITGTTKSDFILTIEEDGN